jgi:NTE family protein
VLGGGGAKSFAQIGVIKALNEFNIPFDAVGGTSMGSLIAGLASMGLDADKISDICCEYIVKNNPMMDFTFPFISMIRAKKYSNRLRSFFKNMQIEDLLIPYFAVATNITRSSIEVMDRGPLWEAVRASTSLPGYVPPFYKKGELLVDGGLMNNVPADIMKNRGYFRIIAVDVAKTDNHESDSFYGELLSENTPGSSPSFLRMLLSLLRKNSVFSKYPTIGNILMRSSLIASRNARENAKKASTIYINLPTESFSLLNFKPISELIDIGYNYASENIETWKKQLSL